MRKRNKHFNVSIDKDMNEEIQETIRYWSLKSLVSLGGYKEFLNDNYFGDDDLARFVGLGDWIDKEEYCQKRVKSALFKQFKLIEDQAPKVCFPEALSHNLLKLKEIVSITETEELIIAFMVMVSNYTLLEGATDQIGDVNNSQLFKALSKLLDVSFDEVRMALSRSGFLFRTGLLEIEARGKYTINNKVEFQIQSFADKMMIKHDSFEDLLSDVIHPSKPPSLEYTDYNHLKVKLDLLQNYLVSVKQQNKKGVNILLYGAPGTGKTELVRLIASATDNNLYEIATSDDDYSPINARSRLRAFRIAQALFEGKNRVLLFDEVEDVFDDGGFFSPSTAQQSKGWLNHMLETNRTPTFWVTNNRHSIDNAFIRRFDMVIEVPVPSRAKRLNIINNIASDELKNSTIVKTAESSEISSAVVSRALAVTNDIKLVNSGVDFDDCFLTLSNETLAAQGYKKISNSAEQLPSYYQPEYINTDEDLRKLTQGLLEQQTGRICLYGPPGTGKTAFVNWVFEQSEKTLISKLVSDLQSPYIGVAEKNIARAFEEAEDEGAILLFDEVDSFLQDRQYANNSWEVSQVNELLKQLERYSGLFFAVTNLVDTLDKASLRRFDLKLKFDFLTPKQKQSLFIDFCQTEKIEKPSDLQLKQVAKIDQITPGDFNVIRRQMRFSPITTAQEVLKKLRSESDMKRGVVKQVIGF